jgi:FAD:protein FMN transferase
MNARCISRSPTLVLVLVWLMIGIGCGGHTDPAFTARMHAFGSRIDLTIVGVDQATAERVSAIIEADFALLHKIWHAWTPGPLGRVNQLLPSGERFVVSASVLPLIQRSMELAARSDNLFNPAIGRLVTLWGFHNTDPEQSQVPAARDIAKLVAANPRMSDLELDGIYLRSRNPAVELDFGAIGKGYGVDLAIEHLRQLGIRNAIVNAGGDLRAIGSRDGLPWRITIRRPSGAAVFATIDVSGDESVFSAGIYERNFTRGGKTYHHALDPRTGYPAAGTRAVTVLHGDAVTTDAAATALLIAGPRDWHRIAKAMGIRYVLLVGEDDVVYVSPEMATRIQFMEQPAHLVVSAPLAEKPASPVQAPPPPAVDTSPPPDHS